MFWKEKKKETAAVVIENVRVIEEPKIPEVNPISIETELNSLELEEYVRVATKVGFVDSPPILLERIKAFLIANQIPMYSVESVKEYLNFRYGGVCGRWQWRPLRVKDDERTELGDYSRKIANYPMNGTLVFQQVYVKPVPLSVLLEVEKVVEEFPTVGFLVSDNPSDADKIPDPFLAVTVPNSTHLFVIAKWDEPGFKE